MVYQVGPPAKPEELGLEPPKPTQHPGALPRAVPVIIGLLREARVSLDSYVMYADRAREDERWEDCSRWLLESNTIVSTIRSLLFEQDRAEKMLSNHD